MDSLFDIEPVENKPTSFCRTCIHAEGWQCGSKVIYYCKNRRSNRTENGLLKIKLKNPSCAGYEAIEKARSTN